MAITLARGVIVTAAACMIAAASLPGAEQSRRGVSDSLAVRQVVESFFRAVAGGSKDSALALMTDEWRAREVEWRNSFTTAFFEEGIKVKSWEIRELTVNGDSAFVSVRATLVDPNGEEDGEPLRFRLIRAADRWLIRALD
jgi:hypothetical protein